MIAEKLLPLMKMNNRSEFENFSLFYQHNNKICHISHKKDYSTNKLEGLDYEKDIFTVYQNFLYKRVLFGLSVYTQEEINVMHFDKQDRIIRVYSHAQYVLNLWKQEICGKMLNNFLEKTFPRSPIVKELIEKFSITDSSFTNFITFKDLGISKKQIVDKLIEKNILPYNFYEIEDPKAPNISQL